MTVGAFIGMKPWRRRRVERHLECIQSAFSPTDDRPLLVTIVHDAEHYLPSFIEHHRELGFGHIVVLDNGSQDQTIRIAQSYDDVSIYRCQLPFREHHVAAREWALDQFGRNRWCLVADCDEHFDWPYRQHLPLHAMIEHLESQGQNALVAHMIDACGESLEAGFNASPDLATFRALYPNLYLSGYQLRSFHFNTRLHGNQLANPALQGLMGGLRMDLFGVRDFATKTPFFHYSGSVKPLVLNSHAIFGARIAGFTGVLRHYKVVADYGESLKQIINKRYDGVSVNHYQISYAALQENGMADFGDLIRQHARPVDELAELEPLGLVELDQPFRERIARIRQMEVVNEQSAPELVSVG